MPNKAVISIVSHGHQGLLVESGLVADLSVFNVVLRENLPGAPRLIGDIEAGSFVQNLRTAGFAANHNRNFELAAPSDEEWFVICNPDIAADSNDVMLLLDLAERDGASIVAPALWNNKTNGFDDNVRPFPSLASLLLSFAGAASFSRYSEDTLVSLRTPNWASGAFIAFKAGLFRQLRGFDESYFMYMEDVDICRRARDGGQQVRFYPEVRLIHNAARNNRHLTSPHFRYHLMSISRYFFKR